MVSGRVSQSPSNRNLAPPPWARPRCVLGLPSQPLGLTRLLSLAWPIGHPEATLNARSGHLEDEDEQTVRNPGAVCAPAVTSERMGHALHTSHEEAGPVAPTGRPLGKTQGQVNNSYTGGKRTRPTSRWQGPPQAPPSAQGPTKVQGTHSPLPEHTWGVPAEPLGLRSVPAGLRPTCPRAQARRPPRAGRPHLKWKTLICSSSAGLNGRPRSKHTHPGPDGSSRGGATGRGRLCSPPVPPAPTAAPQYFQDEEPVPPLELVFCGYC